MDFLVIGSGSGLDVANAAVRRCQLVAIVEKGRLGGTCLNCGCIPSKMLLYHAEVLETIERAEEFGIEASVDSVAFSDIVQEVNEEVQEDSGFRRAMPPIELPDDFCPYILPNSSNGTTHTLLRSPAVNSNREIYSWVRRIKLH